MKEGGRGRGKEGGREGRKEGGREGGREGGDLLAGPPEMVEDDFPFSFLERSGGAPEEGEGGREGGGGREGAVGLG